MPAKRFSSRRPVAAPSNFNPTETWIEGDYIVRYDQSAGIIKRSPITAQTSSGTMYFAVQPAQPEKPVKVKRQLLNLIRRKKSLNKPSSGRRLKIGASAMAMVGMVALGAFLYPFFPELQYRIYSATPAADAQAAITTPAEKPIDGNRLWIPKIGVDTPIVEGQTLDILNSEEGVWHQTGGYGYGNFVLAGHRFKYLPPNTSTLYNLDKLEPKDTFAIDWNGKRNVYEVEKKLTVNAKDTSILNPTFEQTITIYTCSDEKETQRIVIRAKPAAAR